LGWGGSKRKKKESKKIKKQENKKARKQKNKKASPPKAGQTTNYSHKIQ
jgi:hypothetical protein